MLLNDYLIFDMNKKPQPGDISVIYWHTMRLAHIYSFTYDMKNEHPELAVDYPMPEDLRDEDLHQWVNWSPLAFSRETEAHFEEVVEKEGLPARSFPAHWFLGTALRLSRQLAF